MPYLGWMDQQNGNDLVNRGNFQNRSSQPPTWLESGMIFEDRKGNTRLVSTEPGKKIGWPFKVKAGLFFMAALILMSMWDITVPASWPYGMTFLATYFGLRWVIDRDKPIRGNKPVPYRAEKPATGRPYTETYQRSSMDPYGRKTRIGDAERNLVLTELGIHYAAGRLDTETHDARQNEALSAVYSDELMNVLRELPHLTDKERRLP